MSLGLCHFKNVPPGEFLKACRQKSTAFCGDVSYCYIAGQTSPIELGKAAEESAVEAVKVSHLR